MEKTIGDRMKRYEMEEAGRRMMPRLPIMARLDGRAFHTFTRGLERPYDGRFSLCMIETMKHLVSKFNADLGYTQSDEITLYWRNADPQAEMMFDGRFQKWHSLLSASASVRFYKMIQLNLFVKGSSDPEFDCRVWQLPTEQEAYCAFLWREDDATRNSLQMAAQKHYSQKELHKKGSAQLHDLLHAKEINWNEYPAFFKRGTYARRVVFERMLSEKELAVIPIANRPTGPVKRSEVRCLDLPPLLSRNSLAEVLTWDQNREPLE
jgi:tRNA(His) guanylyltransferase